MTQRGTPKPGVSAPVTLSQAAFEILTTQVPDASFDQHDIRLCDEQAERLKKRGKILTLVPESVVRDIVIDGVHPIRAWRRYRGWTEGDLAQRAKLPRSEILEIESGKRKGAAASYKAMARAMAIAIEGLTG